MVPRKSPKAVGRTPPTSRLLPSPPINSIVTASIMSFPFFCYGVILHRPLCLFSSINLIITAVLRFLGLRSPSPRSAVAPVKTKLTVVRLAGPPRQSGVDVSRETCPICRSPLQPGGMPDASWVSDVANVGTFDRGSTILA